MDKDLLYRFFKGNVSIEEGQAVKAWVKSSPENEQSFYKERELFDALVLHSQQYRPSASTSTSKVPLYHKIRNIGLQSAAVAALALLCSYFFQEYKLNMDTTAMNTISVPEGQRTNVVLPDGTIVWLNARTTMQYPVAFNKAKREIRLKGEAYFEVERNENKPFVVKTEKFDVEVLGTKFNVEAYPGIDKFETSLMHGSVKVTSQAYLSKSVTLKPDQKISLEKGVLKVTNIDDYDSYRWKEGLICFTDESFANIMEDFEKYYGIKIVIYNKSVLKSHFTGKFRQSDGIDYAFRILQKNINFDYERDEEKSTIYIK